MNETKHTAEPWSVKNVHDSEDCFITAAKEGRMAYGPEIMGDDYTGYGDAERKQADARRIVACVNACVGIPNEVLEAPGYSIKAELDSLDAQIAGRLKAERERNEYRARLAALEEVATGVDADIDAGRPLEYNVEHLRDELIKARSALGILPEQDAVRSMESHDVQYPGQLYDIDEFRRVPELPRRCNMVPVITENQEDRPVEPNNTGENPEQWASIAVWESVRADRAEAALKAAADRAVKYAFFDGDDEEMRAVMGPTISSDGLRAAIMRGTE